MKIRPTREVRTTGKIQLLDKVTAELIAAGEVIDRPASVIKELCENALDAGTTQLTVEIQRGGVTFMRVTDNGSGIEPEDIRTAFLRHATSKLRSAADLGNLMSLGFRGEALASIAAMCRVEVLSRVPGQEEGVRYCIEGGAETECSPAGCPEGTTIVVRDIFYNTPARMKFLKKDTAEGGAVEEAVERLAVINPRVSVRFLREGKCVLQTPGNNRPEDAVYAVWGREFYQTLTPVRFEGRGIRVRGFVSKPGHDRGSRSMQHFFLNGRPIRSRLCMAALEEAYRTRIMKGRFPACVLDLRMPPGVCDVNVHPAKLEVRFAEEKAVFDAVYYAVLSAFTGLEQQGVSVRLPGETASAPAREAPAPPPEPVRAAPVLVQPALPRPLPPRPAVPASVPEWVQKTPPELRQAPAPMELEPAPPPQTSPSSRYAGARLIGEWLRTYILLECGEKLILIDKHAAHERLLYEELRAKNEVRRQALLEPLTIHLPGSEYAAALGNRETLARLGFGVEDFGEGCVAVREIPTMLTLSAAAESVMQLCERLAAGEGVPGVDAIDDLLHTIACKAAVRAHDETSPEELSALIRLLDEHEDVRFCPHGRPIAVVLTRAQVEKLFGRIT